MIDYDTFAAALRNIVGATMEDEVQDKLEGLIGGSMLEDLLHEGDDEEFIESTIAEIYECIVDNQDFEYLQETIDVIQEWHNGNV